VLRKLKSILGIDNAVLIMSPIDGEVIPVTETNDPIFSEEMLGKGVAIKPSSGCVLSPVNGTIDRMFETFHAVSLVSSDGVQLLIHIGMDTVNLKGEHFTSHVKTGDTVKTGDLLIEFDKDKIEQEGYDLTTPVVICNPDDYEIQANPYRNVSAGEKLIALQKTGA